MELSVVHLRLKALLSAGRPRVLTVEVEVEVEGAFPLPFDLLWFLAIGQRCESKRI